MLSAVDSKYHVPLDCDYNLKQINESWISHFGWTHMLLLNCTSPELQRNSQYEKKESSLKLRLKHLCGYVVSIASDLKDWNFQIINKISSVSIKRTPWPESARELHRPSDRRLSARLVPTFADRGCHVVSVTDHYGRIVGCLDWSRYFFFQAAPLQSCSRGWGPLLLRKYGVGNRTRTSGSVAKNSDH
jgi:hypothetical protein